MEILSGYDAYWDREDRRHDRDIDGDDDLVTCCECGNVVLRFDAVPKPAKYPQFLCPDCACGDKLCPYHLCSTRADGRMENPKKCGDCEGFDDDCEIFSDLIKRGLI